MRLKLRLTTALLSSILHQLMLTKSQPMVGQLTEPRNECLVWYLGNIALTEIGFL